MLYIKDYCDIQHTVLKRTLLGDGVLLPLIFQTIRTLIDFWRICFCLNFPQVSAVYTSLHLTGSFESEKQARQTIHKNAVRQPAHGTDYASIWWKHKIHSWRHRSQVSSAVIDITCLELSIGLFCHLFSRCYTSRKR